MGRGTLIKVRSLNAESGSTMPLVVGVVFLTVALLCAALAMAEIAAERARQQTSADLGALAGANALCKATETTRLIDATIYTRNVSLDVMYVAATIVSIASAGAGAEAFAVPLRFQKATDKPVEALERTKSAVGKAAVVYSIANGASVIGANGGDTGLAVPMPLIGGLAAPSQKAQDLKKLLQVYETRIRIANRQMTEAMQAYRDKVDVLTKDGSSDEQIKNDEEVGLLKRRVHETTGRVGGLTTQRNRTQKKLAALEKSRPVFVGGQSGVVAVVFHRSHPVAFTRLLGNIETGNNLAVAAAKIENGPDDAVIGEAAVRNLLARVSLPAAGDGAAWLMESLNLVGDKARGLKDDYGPIGSYLGQALDRLELTPPALTETRPALAAVDGVLADGSRLYAAVKKALGLARGLEAELGIDVLPAHFDL